MALVGLLMFDMFIKWIAKRWVARYVREHPPQSVISDSDLARLEHPKNGRIYISHDCIEVHHPKSSASAKWCDISEIFAFKRDLLTTDLICLSFTTSPTELVLEPNEEMVGFVALGRELEGRFPGFSDAYAAWLIQSDAFDSRPASLWKARTIDGGKMANDFTRSRSSNE